jgi:hypothetical protein
VYEIVDQAIEDIKKFKRGDLKEGAVSQLVIKGVPIQVQLQYTKPSGQSFTKAITALLPLCTVRDDAEAAVDSTAISLAAIHESARMAQTGQYTDARINLLSVQRLLQRGMKTPLHQRNYMSFIVQAEKLDGFMREAQQQDLIFGSKNEGDRGKSRDDEASKAIFQMKSVSVSNFNKKL